MEMEYSRGKSFPVSRREGSRWEAEKREAVELSFSSPARLLGFFAGAAAAGGGAAGYKGVRRMRSEWGC